MPVHTPHWQLVYVTPTKWFIWQPLNILCSPLGYTTHFSFCYHWLYVKLNMHQKFLLQTAGNKMSSYSTRSLNRSLWRHQPVLNNIYSTCIEKRDSLKKLAVFMEYICLHCGLCPNADPSQVCFFFSFFLKFFSSFPTLHAKAHSDVTA